MSQSKPKRKGYEKIGTIRVGENKETKEKYTYMKLEDNVEIFVNGEKIDLNSSRTLRFEKPEDEVKALLERNIISEEKAEERLEKLSGMQWLRYNVKNNGVSKTVRR